MGASTFWSSRRCWSAFPRQSGFGPCWPGTRQGPLSAQKIGEDDLDYLCGEVKRIILRGNPPERKRLVHAMVEEIRVESKHAIHPRGTGSRPRLVREAGVVFGGPNWFLFELPQPEASAGRISQSGRLAWFGAGGGLGFEPVVKHGATGATPSDEREPSPAADKRPCPPLVTLRISYVKLRHPGKQLRDIRLARGDGRPRRRAGDARLVSPPSWCHRS
jgi:hypothetical protein